MAIATVRRHTNHAAAEMHRPLDPVSACSFVNVFGEEVVYIIKVPGFGNRIIVRAVRQLAPHFRR